MPIVVTKDGSIKQHLAAREQEITDLKAKLKRALDRVMEAQDEVDKKWTPRYQTVVDERNTLLKEKERLLNLLCEHEQPLMRDLIRRAFNA